MDVLLTLGKMRTRSGAKYHVKCTLVIHPMMQKVSARWLNSQPQNMLIGPCCWFSCGKTESESQRRGFDVPFTGNSSLSISPWRSAQLFICPHSAQAWPFKLIFPELHCLRHCYNCFIVQNHLTLTTAPHTRLNYYPTWQMRKTRHREGKCLALGHPCSEVAGQRFKPRHSGSRVCISIISPSLQSPSS